MRPFEYARPSSVSEAIGLVASAPGPAVYLAGGTDLLSLLKDGAEPVRRVVSLRGIQGLDFVEVHRGGARIGALAPVESLRTHEALARHAPALVQAADGIRSPQIRNMGTVGGELLQRPRCWYYRKGFGLLALRDGRSMVREGDNRYHAILGNDGPACFVHASSLAPAFMVLGAEAVLQGPEGRRVVKVGDLFRIPRKPGETERALREGEILTELRVPDPGGRTSATYEVRQKEALDWPLAAASVSFRVEGGRIRHARIVLGHVAPVPWPAERAAESLEGAVAGEDAFSRAAALAVEGARPLSRNAYKVRLAQVAVARALRRAAGAGEDKA